MSPQWIPQNIQKRLLLYILQQLQLFSAIDLPNLEEVSLNNILLKDISIDPEKVGKLPGCNLRLGKLRNVELNGGVSGVNFAISGVELVIAPSVDNLDDDLMQFLLAQSTANLASTVMFEQDGESAVDDDNDSDTSIESTALPKTTRSGSTSSTTSRRSSTIGGMMSRAAEIALLRLVVTVSDINIKFVSDPTDILIHIDTVLFNANNGLRFVEILGVKISTLKPRVNKGHCAESDVLDHVLSTNTSESEDDSDSDYVDESLMESMVLSPEEASSIYMSATSQSFNKGDLASAQSDEAVMAYIDHISLSFEGLSPVSDMKVDIGTINVAAVPLVPTASLACNCISKMLKLKIHQLRKQNAALRRHSKSSTKFPEYDQDDDHFEDDSNEDTDPLIVAFSKLHVEAIVVSLTSALTSSGAFASTSDDVSIDLRNLNVKQKSANLIYGGIEKFSIKKYTQGAESSVFEFENTKVLTATSDSSSSSGAPSTSASASLSKADVRFEFFRKTEEKQATSEITALLSKPAMLSLDSVSLQYLIHFASSLTTVYESLNGMLDNLKSVKDLNTMVNLSPASPNPGFEETNQFLLQTSSFNINVQLSPSTQLKAVVYPISFNKIQEQMSLQRIIILSIIDQVEEQIFTVPNIIMKLKPQEFRHFLYRSSTSTPRELTLQCSNTLSCGTIKGSMEFSTLINIKQAFMEFSQEFLNYSNLVNALDTALSKPLEKISSFGSAGSYASSIYSNQTRFRRMKGSQTPSVTFGELLRPSVASFRLFIKQINFSVKNLFEHFGDMDFEIDHFELSQQAGNTHGFVKSVGALRRLKAGGLTQPFLTGFTNSPSTTPMAFFVLVSNEKNSSMDFVLRRFCVEYYANWIELLKRDVTEGHNAEEIVQVTTPANPPTSTKRSDIHVSFNDFVVGMNPYRLNSKLSLAVSRGNMDFTSGKEQFYIKSSFRELSLFLIDDKNNIKNATENYSQSTPQSILTSMGHVMIGHINSSHLGVTVNTDVGEIKRRNQRLGIRGDLSLVDVKINSDEHQIELCADSAHTLGQTVNDLKAPAVFMSEDKFRVKVEEGLKLPNEILEEIQALRKGGSKNFASNHQTSSAKLTKPAKKDSEDFFIVDDYYNDIPGPDVNIELGVSKLSLDSSSNSNIDSSSILVVEDHFSEKSSKSDINIYPFSFNINLSKTKIYLYDGFDWKQTRKTLRKAVKKLEGKAKQASERKKNKQLTKEEDSLPKNSSELLKGSPPISEHVEPQFSTSVVEDDDDDDAEPFEAISENLFQSINLSLPEGTSPSELVAHINSQVQFDQINNQQDGEIKVNVEKHYKELRLNRSNIHKVLVDLKNIEINLTNFTSNDPRVDRVTEKQEFEKVNNIDVRLDSITVFDNVPTSTWNKILTYMSILGEREIGTSMLKFSLMNVRPDPTLAYTEALINVSILPVRLYIDQDTLEFITRFFEFRDTRFQLPADEMVYIQKLVVAPLKLKFDYKPKKIDYSGLRSGNHAEFVNFFILDGSDIALREAIVYGVPGFPKLGQALGNVYAPYIQKYQLAGLLAGLSPVRSIVNIGGGVKDLVTVPLKEYKKDGRLMRSLQKGTKSFAKTTTYELLKLGVKLASGTQVMLENLEEYFGGEGLTARKPRKEMKTNVREFKHRSGAKKNGILESSLLLKNSVQIDRDPYTSQKLYSALDEVNEEDLEFDELQPSILVFDESSKSGTPDVHRSKDEEEDQDEEDGEYTEKMVSLYSNQPANVKEGLKSAYKSLEKNIKTTKKKLIGLRNDLQDAENFQELLATIAKSSPVIVIRPMIGTTEAVMKTLMGLGNGIDSRYMTENQDKYRSDRSSHGED
ncbi:CIC11C00000001137 [Sungouiella intermedia]|uniref:Autophagy-related protein 2 n=1 Tax=Sungouiella intermedia TaxID=45354 RepID=A0A1L0CX42_9ASCO|nr:CIC11C00000001137 [[Candida] intermedia]